METSSSSQSPQYALAQVISAGVAAYTGITGPARPAISSETVSTSVPPPSTSTAETGSCRDLIRWRTASGRSDIKASRLRSASTDMQFPVASVAAADHPHRQVYCAADHGLAGPGDQARERRPKTPIIDAFQQTARHDQPPGRGVHEQGESIAKMRPPVAACDLVPDKCVARRVVGYPEQCLGEAHQGAALLTCQRKFMDKTLDATAAIL